MNAAELRALLARLEMSQLALARLLGVDPRTVRRWVLDEANIPEPIARLLGALEAVPRLRTHLATVAASRG
jgi:transcriptional regulator with XRE-family HTH domain